MSSTSPPGIDQTLWDRIYIDPKNLAEVAPLTLPLYAENKLLWRQGVDSVGLMDIAAVEIDRSTLLENRFFSAFTLDHLVTEFDRIEVGTPALIVGFPRGFHDHCTICRWRARRWLP